MESIFNKQGRTIAWIKGNELFNIRGQSIGFINQNAVFNLTANYKGTFRNGFFRDKRGNAVAFINGASNGPIPPVPQVPPVAPVPNVPPVHPVSPVPPIPPISSFSWSDIDWNTIIN